VFESLDSYAGLPSSRLQGRRGRAAMRSGVALLAAAAAVAAFSVVAHALYSPVAAVPVASSMLGSVNVSEPLTPLVKTACGDGGLLVIYGAGGRPVVVLVYAQEEAATGGLQGCAAKAATCLMTLGVSPAEAKRTEEALASQLMPRRAAVTPLAIMVSETTAATATTMTTKPVTHSVTTATAESRGVAAGEAGSKTVSGAAPAPRPGGGGASTTRHVSGSWGLRAAASLLAGAAAAAAVMMAWRRSL